MLDPLRPIACQKAREAVSLRLDGELSELGSARLAAHLHRCEECCAHADELEAVATRLRAAPLERLGAAVALPVVRRSRTSWSPRAATAAAAAVVVAGSLFVGHNIRGPASSTSLTSSPGRSAAAPVNSARRRLQLLSLLPSSDRRLINAHATRWAA
jgi:anti-sigma factor RsiW